MNRGVKRVVPQRGGDPINQWLHLDYGLQTWRALSGDDVLSVDTRTVFGAINEMAMVIPLEISLIIHSNLVSLFCYLQAGLQEAISS